MLKSVFSLTEVMAQIFWPGGTCQIQHCVDPWVRSLLGKEIAEPP